MFGVLLCRNQRGVPTTLQAFSGQFNGNWLVPGWAPPLFSVSEFHRVHDTTEQEIKRLGEKLDQLPPQSAKWLALRAKRRDLSRNLMANIHDLYSLTNFTGSAKPLRQAWSEQRGLPTGAGDCCGPKLLHQAAMLGYTPIAMAEFFWGRTNRAGSRRHGYFYPPCQEKCGPLLGYLLCGVASGAGG